MEAVDRVKTNQIERHFAINEWEREAENVMEPKAFDYIAGGSGEEATLKANREAFGQWQLYHRALVDVSVVDTSVTLLGHHLPAPILFAPIGVQTIAHPEGELASSRAAASMNLPFVTSTVSSYSMEEISDAMGGGPRWFQLYFAGDDRVVESMVKRAEAAGYSAIVLTVDTPVVGFRERDHINKYSPVGLGNGSGNYFSDPVFTSMLDLTVKEDKEAAIQKQMELFENPSVRWEAIRKIRQFTDLPILLKGIVHPEDAVLALKFGVDGLIVSNHGGRQLDHGLAAIDALESVCRAVEGKVPVLFDSGIRRGSDIFKALALGADAVLIGRPYIYGLAKEGQNGVQKVIRQIMDEFHTTMALSGVTSIDGINSSYLYSKS